MTDDDLLKRVSALWCALCASMLFTGLWLFSIRYGWSAESVAEGHFGSADQVALGWTTWAEIVWPHLLAISTVTFGIGHLLAFVPPKGHRSLALAMNLVLSGIAHTVSGGLVLGFGPSFAWIKLATFFWFQFSFALATWRILKSVLLSQRKSVTAS